MKNMFKAALLAAATVTAVAAVPQIASAQAVGGIGVADLEDAMQKSNAFVLAVNQIKITYKAQLDAFEARRVALEAALAPKVEAFQAAQKVPNANQPALQVQLTALQKQKQDGDRELATMYGPVQRVTAYVQEQIGRNMEAALKSAMRKKGVGVVLSPNPQVTISYVPSADITNDIVTELNVLVPTVSTAVPAGWQPGQAAGAAAPARPAAPAPAGTPAPRPAPAPGR
jgi:Skp family chaperone for outer membrane proteins